MGETMVPANGVDLCLETFGEPDAPAVLLIAAGARSMDWWEEGFCRRLAGGGRFVIRYDHRDTGRSTSFPAGDPPYTQVDMAGDALGVLDALGIARAHIVGLSLGGGLAQRLAVEDPPRLRTVTLISTSPGLVDESPAAALRTVMPMSTSPGRVDESPATTPMSTNPGRVDESPATTPMSISPGRVDESPAAAAWRRPSRTDYSNRAAAVAELVACVSAVGGRFTADPEQLRQLAERVYDRTTDPAAACRNHWLAGCGPPVRDRLGTVDLPTLIMHGTADPLFSMAHPAALAREIPAARLVPLPGVGHEFPPRAVWDVVVAEILRHTA
ncbi:alpha/beta hydrolase [Actinoplanes sp. ATCC 53533]|uniref:alpha/beta fold hydrolase n=1 Tax=Actinoplanes sp. ATCC 53533 TaxID=1288362 RepID=UPI000F775120|nr:alpha/beta hydrolase [Actinoplanes sp. ATCC 53533]RSM72514.1 alpha/beta hydrolase [Actinoplanes sp. ATCC 53533]